MPCVQFPLLAPLFSSLAELLKDDNAFYYLLSNSAPCWDCVVFRFNSQLNASFLFISHIFCNLTCKEGSVWKKKKKGLIGQRFQISFAKQENYSRNRSRERKILSNICFGWRMNVFVDPMSRLWRRQLQEPLLELLLSASCPWGWVWERLHTNMSISVWSDQLWVPLSTLDGIFNIWSPFLSHWWRIWSGKPHRFQWEHPGRALGQTWKTRATEKGRIPFTVRAGSQEALNLKNMFIPSYLLFPLENESVEEASPEKLVIYSLQRFMLLNPGCCSAGRCWQH